MAFLKSKMHYGNDTPIDMPATKIAVAIAGQIDQNKLKERKLHDLSQWWLIGENIGFVDFCITLGIIINKEFENHRKKGQFLKPSIMIDAISNHINENGIGFDSLKIESQKLHWELVRTEVNKLLAESPNRQ